MSKTFTGGLSISVASMTGNQYISSDNIVQSDNGVNLTTQLGALEAGVFIGNLTMGDTSSDSIIVNAGTTTYVNNEILNLKNSSAAGLTVKASGGSTFMTLDTYSTGTLNLYNNVVCNGGLTTQSIIQMNGTEIDMNESMVIYTKPNVINSFKISTTETNGSFVVSHDMLSIDTTQGAEKIYLPMAGELLNVAMNSQIGDTTNANNMDIYDKVAVKNATDSTSSITGGIVIAGGCGIAKSLYVGTGIYLPTSGGTPSALNYYEESALLVTTFQANGNGGSFTTITQYLTRIGNMCFLMCPTIRLNSNGYDIISSLAVIPPRFRPLNEQTNNIQTVNIGSFLDTGGMVIRTDGFMRLYKSNTAPAFSIGSNSGTSEAQTFFWMMR